MAPIISQNKNFLELEVERYNAIAISKPYIEGDSYLNELVTEIEHVQPDEIYDDIAKPDKKAALDELHSKITKINEIVSKDLYQTNRFKRK